MHIFKIVKNALGYNTLDVHDFLEIDVEKISS
jgi:hypothetical protein